MLIRRLSGLLLAVLAAPGIAVMAAPAQAAACSGASGVTVVVQSPSGTRIGCAPGDPGSGIQALTSAGFSWAAASGNGGGAVCRINNYPPATEESCTRMPPQDAYWAYFHAERGGSWQFSSRGAATYDPAPGSVEGWHFGSGSAPGSQPPAAVRQPAPKEQPQQPAAQSPTAAAGAAGTPKPATRPTNPGTSPEPPATPTKAARRKAVTPATTPTTTPATPPTATSSAQAAPAPAASTPADEDSGQTQGGVSWVWGLALLAVLGAAGGVVALRRRS